MTVETQHASDISFHTPPRLALILLRQTYLRAKLVGWTALATIVLVTTTALLLPNRYTATVVILPPQQGGSTGAAMLAQLGALGAMSSLGGGGIGIKNPNDLQVSLLKSNSVENALVARFQLQTLYHRKYVSSARQRWERMTHIDNGLKDGLIRLSVTDRDPRRATEMASGWVEEYKHFTATLAISEAAQRRLFFERQLAAARDDLARAEEDLKQTQQRTGVIEIDSQSKAMIASAAILRGQVAAKQVEIRAMREFAADQNPDLIRAEQELSGLEAQLAAMDVGADRRTGDLVAPKGQLTDSGLEYVRALREAKYRETIEELLSRQYEGARIDEARQGSIAQIIDPPLIPDRPDSLYRIWIVLGGVLGAVPLALSVAWTVEATVILRRRRQRTGSWSATLESIWGGGAL